MSVEKILTDVAKSVNDFKHLDGHLKRAAEHIETCETLGNKRLSLVWAMACLVCEVAEIDAEAERGKYLEQARALLVAAHGAGIKTLMCCDGQISTAWYEDYEVGFRLVTSAFDDTGTIESLARVLQERAEKSQ